MFGRMIPNPKSFVELFQKWPTGGISLQKWFRYFPAIDSSPEIRMQS